MRLTQSGMPPALRRALSAWFNPHGLKHCLRSLSMSLKIAYIGAGGFSTRSIFPQLARHDVVLSAICDLDEDKAQLAARRFGFAAVYTDFRRMLERERPDAVFCVGGPQVHFKIGK